MTNTRTLKPVAYFRATKKHGIVWGEDCCCADAIFDGDDNYDEQETFSLPVYSADVVESLQKENAELRERVKTLLGVISKRYTDILELKKKLSATIAENEAQAKRIEELEAATEHLGLTPKQAADGLARHKAQVDEIESLRKQCNNQAEIHALRMKMLEHQNKSLLDQLVKADLLAPRTYVIELPDGATLLDSASKNGE